MRSLPVFHELPKTLIKKIRNSNVKRRRSSKENEKTKNNTQEQKKN